MLPKASVQFSFFILLFCSTLLEILLILVFSNRDLFLIETFLSSFVTTTKDNSPAHRVEYIKGSDGMSSMLYAQFFQIVKFGAFQRIRLRTSQVWSIIFEQDN